MAEIINPIQVLDKGYVRLVDTMGSDLTPVNAARVSYDKASSEMSERDERLLKYLASHGHTSPFRHAMLQFEVYAPLMVARQWFKYVVGSDHTMDGWNESSRRYITEQPVFYIPTAFDWRKAPDNSKQGSGDPLFYTDSIGAQLVTKALQEHFWMSLKAYDKAIEMGICAEQARIFLPAYALYVRWYWTASLQSVAHFINQRLANDAQVEIQEYAQAVHKLAKQKFPLSISQLVKEADG